MSIKTKILLFAFLLTFGFGEVIALHVFSVDYNSLSQENTKQLRMQAASDVVPVSAMTRSRNNSNEYAFVFSAVQNTKIVILNEETGSNVVIKPTAEAPAEFQLPPFFLEELRQAVLGNSDRLLVLETNTDLSVRNATSISASNLSLRNGTNEQVSLPRFLYGPKENVREAFPLDRRITNIFLQRPRLIPATDNPEILRELAQLEEEMSYFVFMYELPDGSKIIFDENFNKPAERTAVSTGSNLEFNLSGNLTGSAHAATLYALNIWSEHLKGTVPVNINVMFATNLPSNVLGRSWGTPHFWNPDTETWYDPALGKQLAGFNYAPTQMDIRLEMNEHFNWHFSTTTETPFSRFDWATVMLHEITHGLGFGSIIRSDGRYVYSINDTQGAFTDFPCIFTRQLYQGHTGANLTSFDATQRAFIIVSDLLFAGSEGSYLLAANNGIRARMFAPVEWRAGSSVHHWDPSVNFETFMTPSIAAGQRLHRISDREIAIMRDMGWIIVENETNIPEIEQTPRTPIAFFNFMGIKLGEEPTSGMYIILYCDGTSRKVMR